MTVNTSCSAVTFGRLRVSLENFEPSIPCPKHRIFKRPSSHKLYHCALSSPPRLSHDDLQLRQHPQINSTEPTDRNPHNVIPPTSFSRRAKLASFAGSSTRAKTPTSPFSVAIAHGNCTVSSSAPGQNTSRKHAKVMTSRYAKLSNHINTRQHIPLTVLKGGSYRQHLAQRRRPPNGRSDASVRPYLIPKSTYPTTDEY